MRRQICVTLDEITLSKVQRRLKDIKFRSKSHFIEIAVEEFLKGDQDD